MKRYKVWSDSDSHIDFEEKEFNNLDDALEYATNMVHQYDGEEFRVIANIEDNKRDETIEICENINPCDGYLYEEFVKEMQRGK